MTTSIKSIIVAIIIAVTVINIASAETVVAPVETPVVLIDINKAAAVDFLPMFRVGPRLAEAIVAERNENGPFKSIDDLQRVKGIGPMTIDKNRNKLTISFDSKISE